MEQEGSRHPVRDVEPLRRTEAGSVSGDLHDAYASLSLTVTPNLIVALREAWPTGGSRGSSSRTKSGLTRSLLSVQLWSGGWLPEKVGVIFPLAPSGVSRGGHQGALDGQKRSVAQEEAA